MAINFNDMLKDRDFICGYCESRNIRVKDAERIAPDTIALTVCCNDCDKEWTEYFALVYQGWEDTDGNFTEVCEDCGASIDQCTCPKCEE